MPTMSDENRGPVDRTRLVLPSDIDEMDGVALARDMQASAYGSCDWCWYADIAALSEPCASCGPPGYLKRTEGEPDHGAAVSASGASSFAAEDCRFDRSIGHINWWSVAPIALTLAIVSFTATMCSVTMF